MIVCFVDIRGIVDRHCLNFLFLIKNFCYYGIYKTFQQHKLKGNASVRG